jgi:hypothetical protein
MTPEKMRSFLGGERPAKETLAFLAGEFMPAVVNKLNEPGTRRRMALYGGDRVPENERNLTDVRNRMSLLIEYKLAWIANDVLEAASVKDVFWTNVVANRFPDLEVRFQDGRRGIRVEVKCLEAVAEEKSANFDTLKKDLNPETDFIVVFIWEWFRDPELVMWDRAPKVLKAFVFHASSLADLRDQKWLGNPPNTLGDGFQGFDLRYAVSCTDGQYNEEEGNYGKLLRIWGDENTYAGIATPIIEQTIEDYLEFENFSVWSGFNVLGPDLLGRMGVEKIEPIVQEGTTIGFKAGHTAIIFRRGANDAAAQLHIARQSGVKRIIVLQDKYQWSISSVNGSKLVRGITGKKPKHLVRHLSEN